LYSSLTVIFNITLLFNKKMKIFKAALALLAVAFVVIQFIRPEKNISTTISTEGITKDFAVPDSVQSILKRSCYDCHSNNTVYPWYASVEPVGWYLNKHIQNGKRHVNFDEYAAYRPIRQFVRFKDLIEQIREDEMPLPSYLLIHRYAKLSPDEKSLLVRWSTAMMDTMKVEYPPDSLKFRPRRERGNESQSPRRD
jgi:hypothetical protein